MNVFEAIRTLLAVRQYEDRPIPEEVLGRILEAGRLSGSAMNAQPWHFVVVQDQEVLKRLAAAAPTGPYVAGANLAIVVAVDKTPYALSDTSRAIQNMLLAAWDEGVGGNWVGFSGMDQINGLLGIPADLDVVAILPFGYPAQNIGEGKKKRKPLAEIAHREHWGEPFV